MAVTPYFAGMQNYLFPRGKNITKIYGVMAINIIDIHHSIYFSYNC
jgi:hypothetical protein